VGVFDFLDKMGTYFFNKKDMFLSFIFYRLCACDKRLRKYCIIGLTNIYEYNKEYEKGIKLLEKEIKKLENEDYDLTYQLAHFLSLKGELEKAKIIYESLLNKQILRNENIDYKLISSLIYLYNNLKKYKKSLKLVNAFVDTKSLHNVGNDLFFNVGNTFSGIEQYGKAIEYYKKALDEESDENYQVLYNIGLTYYKVGQFDKTISFYNEALKSNIDTGRTKYALGCVFFEKGDIDEARSYLIDALNDGYVKAIEALKELS